MKTLQVPMTLEEHDGNAFALLATFQRNARRAGYSEEEIKEVMDEATSGTYTTLLQTLIANTVSEHD